MSKYNISKEYKRIENFKSPLHESIFPIASSVLQKAYKMTHIPKNLTLKTFSIVSYDYKTIPLYLYEPNVKTDKIMLYIHGGAFLFKGYPKHFKLCQRYALEGCCKVLYVDYRLAPTYPYPTPVEDCFSAYKWILKNAKSLQIDPTKIIIAGDSAGGCLSSDLCFLASEKNIQTPCLQMLIYPVLDKRMITQTMKEYTDTPMWNATLNKKMWEYYLQGKNYISPNEKKDISMLPQTYIETAEFDCLKEEAIEYAQRLAEAGIAITIYQSKGTVHGFDIISCPTTEKAIQKRIKMILSI